MLVLGVLTCAAIAPLSFRKFIGSPEPEGLDMAEAGSASISSPKSERVEGSSGLWPPPGFSPLPLLACRFTAYFLCTRQRHQCVVCWGLGTLSR